MANALYTPEILALATELAHYPWQEDLPLKGSARSRSCGSILHIGMALNESGLIVQIGVKAQACAIGQAAAAIFAKGAQSIDIERIGVAEWGLTQWLAGKGVKPDWPGIELLEPALAYPGRHDAIKLAWQAACGLLSTGQTSRLVPITNFKNENNIG